MPNLSIKDVPECWVEILRQRATRNHRSLQGELMAIIEEAVRTSEPLTLEQVRAQIRELGVETPAEAAAILRADRDAR